MKCPSCGNNELQQHHRFCCQCGSRIDEKPLEEALASTATTLPENRSQLTTSQVTSSPTADGQPSKENSQVSDVASQGDKIEEGSEVVNQEDQNVSEEPIKQTPEQRASSAFPTEHEKIQLTELDLAPSEITMAAYPGSGQLPAGLDDQNTENLLKPELATADGLLPLETSQTPEEPQIKEKGPAENTQINEQKEKQTLIPKVSAIDGLSDPKHRDPSTPADINENTSPNDIEKIEKPTGQPDTVQLSKEQKDVKQALGKENGAVEQGGDRADTHDQRQADGKSVSTVGEEKQNEAVLRSTQQSAAGRNDGKGAVTTEDKKKCSLHKDNDDDATDARPTTDIKGALQPTTETNNDGTGTTAVQTGDNNRSSSEDRRPEGTGRLDADIERITVIFHALLTPTFSVKFSQGDRVFLRGHPPFSWNTARQVEMFSVREVSSGYYMLEGKTQLTLREASRKIAYKYVVVRPHGKPFYECLIGFNPVVPAHVNRCLSIPETSVKSNTTWHQYDDAVFSEPGFWDSIRNHFPLLKNLAQDPVEGRRMAMLAMLPDWNNISTVEGGSRMNAHAALTEINKVVYCMSHTEFENGGCHFPRILIDFNVMEVLREYFSPRMNLNAQILQVQTEDKDSQTKRLITSVVIASLAVLHNMTILRDDELRDILECLSLISDAERKTCSGFDAILCHFPKKEHLSKLADGLFRLCEFVITHRSGVSAWLFAVPLLHFLLGSSKPFSGSLTSAPSSVKDNSWWGTEGLDFQSVRSRAAISSTSTPVHLLRQLTPMFDVDPLFKRTFLLALPIRDISKILQRKVFSLYEVCWTITRAVEERATPYLTDEEWASLEQCMKDMYHDLEEYDRVNGSEYEAMMSLAQAASQLTHHLLTAHGLAIRKRSVVLSAIFQLLGKSLLFAKRSSSMKLSVSQPSKETQNKVKRCHELFEEAFESLRCCLEHHFSGNLFCESEDWRHEEFQVWSNLLSVKIDDEEFQLFWEREVRKALKGRIHQVSQRHVMELYCELDLRNYHQEIAECLMSAAFEAVENLVELEIKEEHMTSLRSKLGSSSDWQTSGVGKLFALLLKRCWPKGSDGKEPSQDEILQHILSWKPMAQYFKYFGSQGQRGATLPECGLNLLVSASLLLERVGLRLRNAEIDMHTLRILQENRASFLSLCSLVSEVDGNAESSENDETTKCDKNQREISSVELFLDMRIDELEAFAKEREAVNSFVEMCSMVKSVDVDFDEIKGKLGKDPSFCEMLELCHKRISRDEPMVKFFGLSAKNKRMMQSLHHVRFSSLFRDFWHKCLQKAAELCKDDPGLSKRLTIDMVQELVWLPSHRRWRDLWERIVREEISLEEVDKRFDRFREDPKSLDVEIQTALTCFPDEEDIAAVLHRRVDQIRQCQKLTECSDAAETILDFQEAMGLEGDFEVLENLRDQMSSTFHRRSLGSIDDDVLERGSALAQLTLPQIECLKTVIRCKDYIFWLREEVIGREEVKTLVDLAMMSAGESDIETDRVSWLHTTALGFAPFIFDLNKGVGFSQLMDICKTVWEEIEENENLAKKLEGISSHLEWLKGVKDAHAMSSLKLAQAINERGVYCVGKLDTRTTTQPYDKKTVDSVVNLRLPSAGNGEDTFREYSLEKLQELQSKLALISGRQSSGQEDVEKFGQILQGVIHLGQAYVNLCEIGDVSHLDCNKKYECKTTIGRNIINDIQTQSNEFERRYQACKEHINSQRMKYPELNYFTTQQLLFLRKELAAMKHSAAMNHGNMQVYLLLQKVVPDIHQSRLQEVLREAGITLGIDHDEYSGSASDQMSPQGNHEADDYGGANKQLEVADKYEALLSNVEKLGYPEPERLAVAALVANWDSKEAELVIWCVQNNTQDDLLDKLYEEAKKNPMFRSIVDEIAGTESLQPSEDSDDDDKSSSTEEREHEELDSSASEENVLDETSGGTYLSMEEMGVFLAYLADRGGRDVKRRFPGYLKRGNPNLILAGKEHIFAAVLGLYMEDGAQGGLPNSDEVLICTSETTSEEVELLWRRALADRAGERLYCLVHADLLDYDVSQKAVDSLHTLMRDYPCNEKFGLVILCSSENEERAHIVAALEEYRGAGMPRYPRPEELRRHMIKQFKAPPQRPGSYCDQHVVWNAAAEVGRAENLSVRVVISADAGVGKSLVVQRLAEQVANLPNNLLITETMKNQDQEPPPLCVTIPLHDKHARVTDVVEFFLPHALNSDLPLSRIFHLDSSCTVTPDLDTLLFNLLILGELTDDRGRVWRRNPYDLYVLEITYPSVQGQEKMPSNYRFFELLPSVRCFCPQETLRYSRRKGLGESWPWFDEDEFRSEAVQRVWQYLRLYNADPSLIKEFYFEAHRSEGSPEECLATLIRNCGVRNPSWSEIRHFVNFLNYQLHDCEQSAFCHPEIVGDTLEGFRTFVVAFMIIMSKDFAMRSLKGEEDPSSDEPGSSSEESDIRPLQLRRRWERSIHPYIFFNPDHTTFTFLGFQVDEDGNLLDTRTREIIHKQIMRRRLRTGLHVQRVDLDKDFESYSKPEMIQHLCRVMGMEWGHDPDETYELTGDNVKKILAIHMRFRCDIPVIIMGETGCGKTRLIRYMCGLQTGGDKERKNLLLMKIHGGTTFKDIEKNVLLAEAMADKNARHDIDTVLFFDEANTTEALGMIKEIMVDGRCNGRLLDNRLKFIVACNPYRRHTDEMIQRLESAGLGYNVRAEETTERLGRIPLRHLVYRVHELPKSMRSIVWDFGSLQPEVEERYIRQIVGRFVLHERRLPGDDEHVHAISSVLAASQQFMRKRKDECSFVSLRDVKRAMEVMVWFYEHYKQFYPFLQNEDEKNEDNSESEEEEEGEAMAERPNERDEEEGEAAIVEIPRERTLAQKIKYVDEISMLGKHPKSPSRLSGYTLSQKDQLVDEIPVRQELSFSPPSHHTFPQRVQSLEEMLVPQEHSSFLLLEGEIGVFQSSQGTLSDDIDPITWSLILALGVCYQARLQKRDEFHEEVAKAFRPPCLLPGGPERIEREISRCQQAVMKQLKLGPNIACNEALSENVFMMVVCIELRIPLFVVGKPGSSKSLAKAVVADNMQGDKSPSDLFKTFKQIQLVCYQCSPQSTPEGIEATFRQSSELQDRKNKETMSDRFASVVVLDEVGLAEDSPKMPLKTLHPLLEDSDRNDDYVIETGDSFSRVAFIGLSNWALDPAKMNRGIMLSRNEPSENELEETVRGICGSDPDTTLLLEHLISPLVAAYVDLYKRQKNLKRLQDGKKDEFFGLRDFYSLVKMVFHIAKQQKRVPSWKELEHAIKRNFSGLQDPEEDFDPVNIFMMHLRFPPEYLQNEEDHVGLDSINLIQASLDRESVTGEGRYLLILTENFAALPRVKQLLIEQDSEEPYVIFGSSFPKDQLFTQVCRNINRVKICMETGRTVILLNLENLYESLYDALNQYYVTFGGEKYVDLGLGNNRVKCRVHKNFRLIVMAKKDVVYNKFPIPLINRMEKHFLEMSSGLTEPQKQVTEKLKAWVEDFAKIFLPIHEGKRPFKKGDAFVGYHEDSPPAVVLQVCAELKNDGADLSDEERQSWEEKVLKCCQERLLQCATPDSVTRLRDSRLSTEAGKWWTTYFREQEHSSLANFLIKALDDLKGSALRAQISTHSRLLSDRDIPLIAETTGLPEGCVKCVSLQQFQTEQQFCNCIGEFFAKLGGEESLLIVQCDSADQTLDLVACSRHLLIEACREMENELDEESIGYSHILMIVQLPRVAGGCPDFISVQGEGWLSVHIDELCPPTEEIPAIEALSGRSVSKIFESVLNKIEKNFTVRQVLASCVQEAASRIEDDESTLGRALRRVELLLTLLSSKTPTGEDDGRFEVVLAERLCQLLQQKDQRTRNEGNEWLESEALSGKRQETGTFKKALWRRFLSVVAPVLAEVIAYVDRDGNLELAASEDSWVANLWLKIFRDTSLTYLDYTDFIFQEGDALVVRSKVPVLNSGYRSHSFQSSFPFSWLLKERMDELYRDARSVAANSPESVTECLRRLLNNSEVKVILSEAITEGGEAVVARYLHDFTHMSYKPQDDDELEIVQRAIAAAAKEIHVSELPDDGFAMDLPAVHTAHSRIQQRLNCLTLLLQAKPDILSDLINRFSWDENEMTVDAIALQMCLERMEPQAEDFKAISQRQAWCDVVLSIKMPVETIIGKGSSGDKARVGAKTESIVTQCRYMWQRLSAVRMFIEHVYPSDVDANPKDVQTILRLWKALGDETDFSKLESLTVIERFLLSCSEESFQRLQDDKPECQEKFLQRCNAFFMEIVSVFCFGDDVRHLDPAVFEMLMRYVVGTELAETKQFSPFPRFGMDRSPVVRSFLLQQLINSSDEKAKKHLERFLYKAQGLSSEVPHVMNVCLLAVQCMENACASTFAKNSDLELPVSIGIVNKLCQDALEILEKDFTSSHSDELQVASLEAIAKARYTLEMTAEFLYMSVVSGDKRWSNHETRGALDYLLSTVKALCTSGGSRCPGLFLLKQLVKRYGVHSIALTSQYEELSWIFPAEFQRRADERMTLDRFLVYGELYRKVRDSLAGAILSENIDELIASLEALGDIPGHAKDVMLLLALYREVTLPKRMAQNQQIHPGTYSMIKDVILRDDKFLSRSARRLASVLLENSQEVTFPFFLVDDNQSEIEKALPEILIHVSSLLQCIDFDELLEPLNAILLSPRQILGSFLPTMPEDSFPEALSAMTEGGTWYQCPAGHRYFVGDCGKPDQQRDCPECHEPVEIGGLGHHLVQTNRLATRGDRSNKGHVLGAPQKTVAERDLSPAMVSLLRVVLHSALLAGCSQQPEVFSQLFVPDVQADEVCGFLWGHLVNDLRNLSTSLGRSEDEVMLAIHLVLSDIVERATSRLLDDSGSSMWSTKDGRRRWENEFWKVFVSPFWKNFEERLQTFFAVSVNDRRLGSDPLMREVYEVDGVPSPRNAADIHPGHAAFWRYRTRVTVEHVVRQFQDMKSSKTTCKILGKFLDQEHVLRALYYLPDIVALQKMLTDRLCRRVDKEKANQQRIRDFLQDLPKGQKENVTKLFGSFRTAWDLVRHHLSSQGRFAPTKEECLRTIDKTCPVSVLLPTSEGPGICCKGLMFFSVNAHNELVEAYCNSLSSSGSSRSTGPVSLSEVSVSQLIAYDSEKELLPVMLANCSYSLEVGRETQLQYNWETLEKQIIDRFIRGRPRVEFEVEDFMFREDARDENSFAALKDKIPQEPIPGHTRTQILSELKDLRDVSDVISTLEIVIAFLSSAGGNPEVKLSEYCSDVLQLSNGKATLKSKKAQQSCSLSHILDLWRTLALARAKCLLANKQDPFEQVPEFFKTEMPKTMIARFTAALRKVNVELFLSKVVEVIILKLAQEDKDYGEMGLAEYLSTYFGENEEDGFPGLEEIPEDVCLKHVIYAWQLALEDSERGRGRRRSMMT